MSDSTQPPQDPLWGSFDQVDAEHAARLEEGYKQVEGYNAELLNQVASIADSNLKLVGSLSENPQAPPDLSLVRQATLYLRPDRQGELSDQGERASVTYEDGFPYSIVGDIPPRSQKLIEDLLTSTEAVMNEPDSTPTEEIWSGNIAGEPIDLVLFHKTKIVYLPSGEEARSPTLMIRAYRGSYREQFPKQ